MSEFTYEYRENKKTPLENFEWDNIWWEQNGNKSGKRVVYIGDSISCGTRRIATSLSENEYLFDGFGTSKAVDNPYFRKSLSLFLSQCQDYSAVLFNNGLHGWHLTEEEYKEYYKEMLIFLKENVKVPIFVLLTTNDDIHPGTNDRVIVRNKYVTELAEELSLPVVDLYSVSVKYNDLHTPDKIHFTNEGYSKLAEEILNFIKNANI